MLRKESAAIRRLAPFPKNLKHSLLRNELRVRRIKNHVHADEEHSG